MIVFARTAVGEFQTGKFGGITGFGAGAMSFNQFNGLRAEAGDFISPAQRARLTFWQGGVNAVGASIRCRTDTADDRINTVAVALGIVKALERHHCNAFAEQGAVSGIRERPAITSRRKCRRLAETHVHENVVHRIDTAGDDKIRLPQLQFVDAHRNGGQRTGAGRISHGIGAAQVKTVGDTAGNHVAKQAGE